MNRASIHESEPVKGYMYGGKRMNNKVKKHNKNCKCGFKQLLEGYKLRSNPNLTREEVERWANR